MKAFVAFVGGVAVAVAMQAMIAGATPSDDPVAGAGLKLELELLKTQVETSKVEMSSRVQRLEFDLATISGRLQSLESGEAKQIPLERVN